MNDGRYLINDPLPFSVYINLDTYYNGSGIKDLHVTIFEEEFIITKEEIRDFLRRFKEGK